MEKEKEESQMAFTLRVSRASTPARERLREMGDRIDALEDDLREEEKENVAMDEDLRAWSVKIEAARNALRRARSGDMYWQSPEEVENEKEEVPVAVPQLATSASVSAIAVCRAMDKHKHALEDDLREEQQELVALEE